MEKILAIDLGSTQMKLLCINMSLEIVSSVTERYETYSCQNGYLEQRPDEWLTAMGRGLQRLAEQVSLKEITAISFSGHMSGVVALDRNKKVLFPCIMLSDSRSDSECRNLKDCIGDRIREVTGNPVINAFSLPKLLWIKNHVPEVYQRIHVWVSPKDYLRYELCGQIGTEYTDAYNSLCVDPTTGQYDEEIIRGAGLHPSVFPDIYSPFDIAGHITTAAASKYGFREGIPVIFGAADMACGAIGNGLFHTGETTLTLGTSATMLSMVDKIENDASYGKVTYHMHAVRGSLYALGSHFNGGMAVNYMTKLLSERSEVDFNLIANLSKQAEKVPAGSGGVLTIPFLVGSGSPYFRSDDRQHILFMSANTSRAALFRSELEGITYNLKETLYIFEQINEKQCQRMVLGGGGTKIGVWPQMIADIFDRKIYLADYSDSSTIGAALIGGVGAGLIPDIKAASSRALSIRQEILPNADKSKIYHQEYQRYHRYYEGLHAI